MPLLLRSTLSSAALSLLCTAFALGQAPAPSTPGASAADPFAAESFVIQRQDSVFSFNADGTGYRESTLAVTVQTEAALRNFSVVSISFASSSEKVEFHYVRVRRHDGTVVETPIYKPVVILQNLWTIQTNNKRSTSFGRGLRA